MSPAFSQLSVAGASLALLAGLVLLWRRRSGAHIAAFAAQSVFLAGTTAVATAEAIVSGPGGVTGYVFDDETGYTIEGATVSIGGTAALTDASGVYAVESTATSGIARIWKDGFTSVDRVYSVAAGGGASLFDARVTRLDATANTIGSGGGTATGDDGRITVG